MSASILQQTTSLARRRRTSAARRTGLVLSGIAVLFLVFDAAFKFVGVKEAADATAQLEWPLHHMPLLGAIEVACLALYLVPRTAPLGALLWTGYLGGAIATHLRLDNPLFTHVLFPIYVAALLWGGLALRDARVRDMARSILRGTR